MVAEPSPKERASRRAAARRLGGALRSRRARAMLATFLICGIPDAAQAHAIHSTLTEISTNAGGRVVVRVRTFADDFSTAVSRHVHAAAAADLVVPDANAAQYLQATLLLTDRAGRRIPLSFKSQHRTGDVVWLELEGAPASLSGARVRSAMLFEVHADQVNIVKASYASTAFTTLFSVGDAAKTLP
ncbi:MAG: DUF6702 family protein [Gemmatimonadaceae bacterium]